MADAIHSGRVHYEIRYVWKSWPCTERLPSLEEAWERFKFLDKSIRAMRNFAHVIYRMDGCYRCQELNKINFEDYKDTITKI